MRLWKRREAGSTSSWRASNTTSCSVRCARAGALPARWRHELCPVVACIALVLLAVRPSPPLLSCSQFPAAKAKEAGRLRAPAIPLAQQSHSRAALRLGLAGAGASIDGSDMPMACAGLSGASWKRPSPSHPRTSFCQTRMTTRQAARGARRRGATGA